MSGLFANKMLRVFLGILAGSIALLTAAPCAVAQSYPGKPLRLIVASPPGNPSDLVLRAAVLEMAPRLGQPVVVDNRVGASEIIAQETCARSAPDGYTMCVVSKDGMAFNPNFYLKLSYDPDTDYRPVARLYYLISVLAAGIAVPVTSVAELQALAIAKPGALNFGTRGVGSNQDFLRHSLAEHWKTSIVGVPYKGTNFVFNALLAGEIHLAEVALGNVIALAQKGKLKVLAINMSKRFALMPEVPLYQEVGFEGAAPYWGIVVPAGTADAIVARLNAEFLRVFREPKMVSFMESRYLEIALSSPEEFASFMKADREHIGELVRKYNIPRQ